MNNGLKGYVSTTTRNVPPFHIKNYAHWNQKFFEGAIWKKSVIMVHIKRQIKIYPHG